MRGAHTRGERFRWCLEGAITGLAYATGLAALSVFAVGSFHQRLPTPYWRRLAWLRTDGFGCFVVATFSFCINEFLRLSGSTVTRGTQRRRYPGC